MDKTNNIKIWLDIEISTESALYLFDSMRPPSVFGGACLFSLIFLCIVFWKMFFFIVIIFLCGHIKALLKDRYLLVKMAQVSSYILDFEVCSNTFYLNL